MQVANDAGMMGVVGTGPAGLMAAHVLASAGARVRLFERRRGAGHKLLIAGSSGLNITYDAPLEDLIAHYAPAERMRPALEAFPPAAWLRFVEDLGVRTFKGTSRRWFIEGFKAPPLLSRWMAALEGLGVEVAWGRDLVDLDGPSLTFADGSRETLDAVLLALGGGSWEKQAVGWPRMLRDRGVDVVDLRPSNIGFRVAWPPALLAEAEGRPIKNVVLRSSRGERAGDLVITAYGLEGTPVYFAGEVGTVRLDLKPDLSMDEVHTRLHRTRENLSPMRRVKRLLKLSDGALALVWHMAGEVGLDQLPALLKSFPVRLEGTQPLAEAISSAGGVAWTSLDPDLMLRAQPGVFAAGEMIDWDAPTGGFLIQGCVSQGRTAAEGMLRFLR